MFEPLLLARTAHFAAAAMLSGPTFFVLFVAEPVWARVFAGPRVLPLMKATESKWRDLAASTALRDRVDFGVVPFPEKFFGHNCTTAHKWEYVAGKVDSLTDNPPARQREFDYLWPPAPRLPAA